MKNILKISSEVIDLKERYIIYNIMEEHAKQTEKKILITKKNVTRNDKSSDSLQLAKNREKTRRCRNKQNISSISSRLVMKIPEPTLQINRYETPIILSFD